MPTELWLLVGPLREESAENGRQWWRWLVVVGPLELGAGHWVRVLELLSALTGGVVIEMVSLLWMDRFLREIWAGGDWAPGHGLRWWASLSLLFQWHESTDMFSFGVIAQLVRRRLLTTAKVWSTFVGPWQTECRWQGQSTGVTTRLRGGKGQWRCLWSCGQTRLLPMDSFRVCIRLHRSLLVIWEGSTAIEALSARRGEVTSMSIRLDVLLLLLVPLGAFLVSTVLIATTSWHRLH